MSKLTIKQSVINVCDAMTPGETLIGYEFYNRVLREFEKHNVPKKPLDSTVFRVVREEREFCNMETFQSISKYRKKVTTQLSKEEQSVGQRPLF